MKKNINNKRRGALERLEAQLLSGKKNAPKQGIVTLNENDKKRINKEIEILKTKV